MEILNYISNFLIIAGCFFLLTSSVGLIRMKDFYTRAHPAGINDSLSLPLIFLGIMIKLGIGMLSLKLGIILLISMITAATATHALTKAAIHDLQPTGRSNDEIKRNKNDPL